MKKLLFALSIVVASFTDTYSQGAPACPSLNAGIGTGGSANICPGQCVPLAATPVTNNQTTSYNVAAIPYAPYPYTGGTAVSLGTDDVWSPVASLGFPFCYFGTSYTQAVIGSNGHVTFDLTQAGGFDAYNVTTPLPSTVDMPANTICAVFRDIDPTTQGTCAYYTTGTAPCRAMVIYWSDIPLFSCGTPHSTFQLVLYENTNFIDVYIQNSDGNCSWQSGNGITGLLDPTGTIATCPPGRNCLPFTANNEAWRFSPAGVPSYTVTWTDPSGVIGTGLNINVCPMTSTTYTATMVLTNCTGSTMTLTSATSITVTPGTAVTVNSPTICAGASVVLTPTGSPTYTWSANAGGGNATTVTVTPAATTVYTVTGQGGGSGGCTPIATSTVTVIPNITVTVNNPAPICTGASATLTANGATNYTWMPGGMNTPSIVVTPTATTVYTVTGSSGACPSSSATTTVTIVPSISVNSTTICSGTATTLTATGAANYTWTPGGATTSTISVSPVSTTVYTVNSGGGGACSIAEATVTVVPALTVTVNSPPTVCAGVPSTLTANGAATYAWSPPAGLSSTVGNTVTATPATTTIYTVTGSAPGCPSASATSTVTIIPTATITVGSATICPTTSATLTAVGGTTYNWSPPTGLSATSGASVTSSPAATTVYTVSGGACDIPGTCTVTVTPGCTITVNSATICPNATATLTANGNGGGTYSWAPATGLSATTGASVTASPASTTVYTVTGTSAGFTTTATSTVVVSSSPTISVNNATICQGTTTSLVANGASTYTWTPATGLSATTASAVVASPTVTTTYTITGTSTNTCTNTTVATIGVNPMPTVSLTPTDTFGCQPLCVKFSGLSSTSAINYSWNFGDGQSSTAPNPTNCFKYKGVFTPTLTLTDGNSCKGTATATITVYAQPHADFGVSPQPVSILEPNIQFTDASTNGPIVGWNWNFGVFNTTTDSSAIKNPVYTYQDTGYYTVKLWVITQHGCKDSTTKIVKIDDDYELFVPTAFSPNGDGLNEFFLPVTRGVVPTNYHLYVYDRWGNLIFNTDILNKGWDGSIKGTVVMEDVYVWKILLKTTAGTQKQVHGQVSIIK
jgi:trimeric autotransporter adhesin